MTPPAIVAAEAHRLTAGRNAGRALSELDDATLTAVADYYRPRDFYEWQAAHLTRCARIIRRDFPDLLAMPAAALRAVTGDLARCAIADWLLQVQAIDTPPK